MGENKGFHTQAPPLVCNFPGTEMHDVVCNRCHMLSDDFLFAADKHWNVLNMEENQELIFKLHYVLLLLSLWQSEVVLCKNFQLLLDTPYNKICLGLLTCYLKQVQQEEHNIFYHIHPN